MIRAKNRRMKSKDKEIYQRKIDKIKQDKQVICKISQYSNHINNQDLATQMETIKD